MSTNKRVVFISGRLVNLRPVMKSEVNAITRWVNDPKVRHFIGKVLPQTEKQEEDWFNKLGESDKHVVLGIETKEGVLIGVMGIHDINRENRTATTGALIGEKEYWGRGYGTDAKMFLLQYAFETLNLHKICSNVIAFNKRSLQYSLHCGYKLEGRRRKHVWRVGKYWDLLELGLFRKEWQPIWRRYKKTGKVR